MKFIALKTKDGGLKGDTAFFCRVLHVSRQGFYQYPANKDCPWKYQPLAEAIKEELIKAGVPSVGALIRQGNINKDYFQELIDYEYEYVLLEKKLY